MRTVLVISTCNLTTIPSTSRRLRSQHARPSVVHSYSDIDSSCGLACWAVLLTFAGIASAFISPFCSKNGVAGLGTLGACL